MLKRTPESPWYMRAVYFCGLLFLGLGALSLFEIRNVSLDNRLEKWADPGAAESERYAEFVSLFGSDEFIVIALSGRPIFEEESLDAMVAAVDELETLPSVDSVSGIPVIYRDLFGLEDAEALREEIVQTPYYRRLYLSDDESTAALVVQTDFPDDAAARRQSVHRVLDIADGLRAAGFEIDVVGPPVLNVYLNDLSRKAGQTTFPIAIGGSLVLLVILLGSFRAALVPALPAGLTVTIVFGTMARLGFPLNMLTTTLPALLLVLSLGNGIHLVRRYRITMSEGGDHAESVATALRAIAYPNMLSSITTAGGFLSLLVAGLVPVREFGLVAAGGILLNLLINLTVGPLTLSFCRPPPARSESLFSTDSVAAPGAMPIFLVTAAGVLISIVGVFNIELETNPLSFLPNDSKIVHSYERVSESLAGLYSLEAVVELPGPWTDPAHWEPLDALRDSLEQEKIVTRVITPLDVLRLQNQWGNELDPEAYALPETQSAAQEQLEELGPTERAALERYVAQSGDTVRLSILVNEMSSAPFLDLAKRLDAALTKLPSEFRGTSTGIIVGIVTAQEALVKTQQVSLLLASCIVLSCLLIGLRSIHLVIVAIFPNALPLLFMFGTMGILGIKLDPATAMVASVALGIAVDDTVHLLVAYSRERRRGADATTAIGIAVENVSVALKITTAVACLGFLTLLFSTFAPIRNFGLLATIGMIVALLADLYLVPALIRVNRAALKERIA